MELANVYGQRTWPPKNAWWVPGGSGVSPEEQAAQAKDPITALADAMEAEEQPN